MAHLIQPLKGLARRLRRGRRGSVLVLVVTLLVLMALIGTAWLVSARTDRAAAQQHSYNVQIEMLLDGVARMTKGVIANDLFLNASPSTAQSYRKLNPAAGSPPFSPTTPFGVFYERDVNGVKYAREGYEESDSYIYDWWLSSRTPILSPADGTTPTWVAITEPLGAPEFESPYVPPTGTQPLTWNQRYFVQPTSITIPYGATAQEFPALSFINIATGRQETHLAADADGDGIADAGLWKLPVGELNGVTYYVGVRITDQNSALNVNVHWKPNEEADFTGFMPGNFFPCNVDLEGMLFGTIDDRREELDRLIRHRYANTPPVDNFDESDPNPTALQDIPPNAPLGGARNRNISWPVDGNFLIGAAMGNSAGAGYTLRTGGIGQGMNDRRDFRFISWYDQFWQQSGRRQGYMGYYFPNSPFIPVRSADKSLAYRGGVMLDPTAPPPNPNAQPPRLEDLLANTLAAPRTTPYQPSEVALWFNQNHNHASIPHLYWTGNTGETSGIFNRRLLLVGSNPISPLGTTMYVDGVPGSDFSAAAINTTFALPNRAATNDPVKEPDMMPGTLNPAASLATAKASVNTATFGELWRAYWATMAAIGTGNVKDPITGPISMFRSPLRALENPGGTVFPPRAYPESAWIETTKNTALLRSAIAAVNTIDLRDSDHNVTSKRIYILGYVQGSNPATSDVTPIEVTVFGQEPQPYITEVYVNNDDTPDMTGSAVPGGTNARGYIAVELYNPHPFPISLGGWTLGVIERRSAIPAQQTPVGAPPYPTMDIRWLSMFRNGWPVGAAAPVIQAGGRLVLHNYNPANQAAPEYAAATIPASSGELAVPPDPTTDPMGGFIYVPTLHEAMGDYANTALYPAGELVLLRPRNANGLPSSGTVWAWQQDKPDNTYVPPDGRPTKWFQETTYNEVDAAGNLVLEDMVPVDSFDLSNIDYEASNPAIAGTTPDPDYTVLHYARRNVTAWDAVYPGRWTGTRTLTDPFRQEVSYQRWDTAVVLEPVRFLNEPQPFNEPRTGVAIPLPTLGSQNILGTSTVYSKAALQPIQLNLMGFVGPNPVLGTAAGGMNFFPFGGFARELDILHVPFVGAYRMRVVDSTNVGVLPSRPLLNALNQLLEMNPVTWDIASADDFDPTNDAHEQVGRFVSLGMSMPDPTVTFPADPYLFARDLLNNLTVQAPHDDQFPNAYPGHYRNPLTGVWNDPMPQPVPEENLPTAPAVTYGYVAGSPSRTKFEASSNLIARAGYYATLKVVFLTGPCAGLEQTIQSYLLTGPTSNPTREITLFDPGLTFPNNGPGVPLVGDLFKIVGRATDTAPIQGLININTAPWRVLAAVPWFPRAQDENGNNIDDNEDFARALVLFRDGDPVTGLPPRGPFNSILDLQRFFDPNDPARGLWNGWGKINPTAFDPDDADGDLTPHLAGTDGTMGDFESRFLKLNGVINMLTTRSDSFTVHIVVQGWRNAGTSQPELVVQRRLAFLVDRTGVTPTQLSPNVTRIPTE